MTHRILVLYGSYRSDRMGIRLAHFVIDGLRGRGDDVELIDAKEVGLPMLDRMYKEHPKGQAPAALEAWKRGRTGYPLVDAGMRQLWTTGWMHNRVRMVVASFLIKHLLIDWREGEAWFWDTLVDADRASNVQGAFGVADERKADIQGRRVVLVDDVLTSGATVDACARALLRAKAAQVDVLVFARVVDTHRAPI